MRRQRGFTLAEALVVVAVIGIIAAIGFPAMTRLLVTQSVRSAAYDLFADLIFARSEAIARGGNVSIASVNGMDWKGGWRITDADGTMLREQSSRTSAIVFAGTAGGVTFDRNGRASTQLFFNIVPDPSVDSPPDSMKRCIRLDPSGRPKSAQGGCV